MYAPSPLEQLKEVPELPNNNATPNNTNRLRQANIHELPIQNSNSPKGDLYGTITNDSVHEVVPLPLSFDRQRQNSPLNQEQEDLESSQNADNK